VTVDDYVGEILGLFIITGDHRLHSPHLTTYVLRNSITTRLNYFDVMT